MSVCWDTYDDRIPKMVQKHQMRMTSTMPKKGAKPLTLMEKWEAHKTSGQAETNAQAFLVRLAPLWYLVTVTGCFLIGTHQSLFIIYEGWSRSFIFCHQVFAYVAFIEMMINWFCLRFVTSDFTWETAEKCKHLKFNVSEDEIMEKMTARGMKFGAKDQRNQNGSGADDTVDRKSDSVNRGAVKRHISHLFANKKKETVSMGTGSKNPRKYAYWSWRPCDKCKIERPPRVAHCPVCDKCSLKRDHHCYFSGTCIALHNQRHFIVFSLWSCLATVYSTMHAAALLYIDVIPMTSWWDLIFPVTCFRWLLGYTGLYYLIVFALVYSLVWFCPISLYFFQDHIKIVRRGITTFEHEKNIHLTNSRTQYENFKSVFGDYWILNFILPLHFFYKPRGNGFEYPNIKVWYIEH